mmetsp:Transcript_3939/g.2325  ORF Transcript_3939/g.2325 Transcript_3939/m.2325 type:complete len:189 (-) Transcript_3939:57-623(-)
MENGSAGTGRDVFKVGKVYGFVTIFFGLLAIGSPLITGLAVSMLVGIVIILAGITQTAYAFHAGSFGKGFMRLLFGGITTVFGVSMVVAPMAGLASLTIILIFYFLIDGIVTIMAGFQLQPTRGWGWMVFSGVITLLLSLMIWRQWPVSGAWAIGILVGVRMLFAGLSMITISSLMKEIGSENHGGSL